MSLKELLTDPGNFKFYRAKGYSYGPREVSWDAGTPANNGVMANGANSKPLITTPLPKVDSQTTPETSIDQFYRGTGVLPTAVKNDTLRISKFLLTEQGLQFLAKEQALLLTQNIRRFGNNIRNWEFINPASYVENTTLAPTGEHLRNTFTFGLKPTYTRESTYKEPVTVKTKKERIIKRSELVDRITTSPMYLSKSVEDNYLTDTVPFYLQKIDNSGNGQSVYIHFRAYLSGLGDSFNADWKSTKYMGRGEDFYSYNGFSRELTFGFDVPVLSAQEQSSVYSKLNYLASCMAPDYTESGFMRGNLFKLTIGDYVTNLPGIIKGISFDFDAEAGWEISNFDAAGNKITPGTQLTDDDGNILGNGYVMPKLIKVSSINFTPIHNFVPQTVSNAFIENGKGTDNNAPFITFGKTGNASAGGYVNTLAKK